MFEQFEERISRIFSKLQRKPRLAEEDIQEVLRSIRTALLESDVHYQVVRDFVQKLKPELVGQELKLSLDPASQVVKCVFDNLVACLGEGTKAFHLPRMPHQKILLVGLQGVGKTTTAGKLALFFKKKGHDPLLLGLDRKRFAADMQLRKLAKQIGVDVLVGEGKLEEFLAQHKDFLSRRSPVIVDTAGRLHIDESMMEEIKDIARLIKPDHSFFVADALTGQDMVNQIRAFADLPLTGVVLTKMDGDTRGGAALSIKQVTGLPILFMGTGEKLQDFQVFHPERVARRLLGMGDVMSLLERAEEAISHQEADELERKLRRGEFTLEDFRKQFGMMKKLGSMKEIAAMAGLPLKYIDEEQSEKEIKKIEAIINSMTVEERLTPEILNGSRKRRIARGSGRTVQEVNLLLKQFEMCKVLVRRMGGNIKPGLINKIWR